MASKILIVGAGAVGQIYGKRFQQGGAEVAFLVKEKHRAALEGGLVLYWLQSFARPSAPVSMSGYGILSSPSEVAKQRWDAVIFCMSSTGLRGPWLDELLPAIGDASIVTLQPGLEDRTYLLGKISADRLIEGTIPIVSYATPLPGETWAPQPGIASWTPPGQQCSFSGPAARIQPLLQILRKGGFPCRVVPDAQKSELVPAIALSLLIAALESEAWSFRKLEEGDRLRLACQGMREGCAAVARKWGVPQPRLLFLLQPFLFRFILTATRWVVPFDFETYLKVHFTKVQDQMHQGLRDYITAAEHFNLPSPALREMTSLLGIHP